MSPQGSPPNRDPGGHGGSDQPAPGAQPGEPDWYAPFTPAADLTAAPAPSNLPPWPGQSEDDPFPVDPNAAGPFAQGPHAQGPYAQGPYAQGPYAQGPYAQGPYGGPSPNFPMGPPGWQGRMFMGRRPVGAYIRRRAITHITMGFLLLFAGIAITAGSYASAANSSDGGPYFVTWGMIIFGIFWIIGGFAMLARSARLP